MGILPELPEHWQSVNSKYETKSLLLCDMLAFGAFKMSHLLQHRSRTQGS